MKTLNLPPPSVDGLLSVEAAISSRRTIREYSAIPVKLSELSQLLWAAQGMTQESKRAVPSAVGQYPLHLLVMAGEVENVSKGLYSYNPIEHSLECLSGDDVRPQLCSAALGEQPWIREAAVVIIVLAESARMKEYFKKQAPEQERGIRYTYMEAGALAHNVHLQATALDLGMVLVGGFDDGEVVKILGAEFTLQPAALLCIGNVK